MKAPSLKKIVFGDNLEAMLNAKRRQMNEEIRQKAEKLMREKRKSNVPLDNYPKEI